MASRTVPNSPSQFLQQTRLVVGLAILDLGGAHVPKMPSCSSPRSDHEDFRRRPAKRLANGLGNH
jgi:hypothetical protein